MNNVNGSAFHWKYCIYPENEIVKNDGLLLRTRIFPAAEDSGDRYIPVYRSGQKGKNIHWPAQFHERL
jgi:hypothetical protein